MAAAVLILTASVYGLTPRTEVGGDDSRPTGEPVAVTTAPQFDHAAHASCCSDGTCCSSPTSLTVEGGFIQEKENQETKQEGKQDVNKSEQGSKGNQEDQKDDSSEAKQTYNELNRFEKYVILGKGTERAFSNKYWNTKTKGTYICKRCNAPLYRSDDKFDSGCGWPSFDAEIEGAVTRQRDRDGIRIEIICSNCGGHLGHVFYGEGFTIKNTRHCVNSVSMQLIPEGKELPAVIKPKQKK